jgi:hypothetical protein
MNNTKVRRINENGEGGGGGGRIIMKTKINKHEIEFLRKEK